jgi:hypothetical protein
MARRVPDKSKERSWRRLLREWQRSGQSIRAFCRARAVSEPSFYFWRQTLAQRDRQRQTITPPQPHGSKVTAADLGQPAALFAPLRLIDAAPLAPTGRGAVTEPPPLEVLCRGGRIVRVAVGFDPAAVRALVAALEELPC